MRKNVTRGILRVKLIYIHKRDLFKMVANQFRYNYDSLFYPQKNVHENINIAKQSPLKPLLLNFKTIATIRYFITGCVWDIRS